MGMFKQKNNIYSKDRIIGRSMILVLVLFILLLEVYPIYKVIEFSLFKQQIISSSREFIGIHNFITIFNQSYFWVALKNSLIWTFGVVFLQLIFGIIVALILNEEFPGRNIHRSLVLFSYLIPTIVVAIMWKFMVSGKSGIINYFLSNLFLNIPTNFLSNPKTALLTVMMIEVWKNFPFMVIVFLAQLQTIPKEQYEAARVDGANKISEIWHITLPHLKPVIFIALMLRTIFEFNYFDLIYMLTGGGPINFTTTLPILTYKVAFKEYSLGQSSALAVIILIIVLITSFLYLNFYNKSQKSLN